MFKMLKRSAIKKCIPPIVIELRRKFEKNKWKLSSKKFIKWWENYKISHSLPKDMVFMMDYYIASPSFRDTSSYWNYLCRKHIEIIEQYGIADFKQTIERMHYWGEAKLDSVLINPLLSKPVSIVVKTEEIFKLYGFCSIEDSIQYNLANIVMLNYIVNNGYGDYLNIIEESLFGNPVYIKYNDKRISFALLNSILEVDAIKKNLAMKDKTQFLELGAGSGRTAVMLMTLYPNSKYIIVDIPPTLYICYENITHNFPDKKIFNFCDFNDFSEVKDDFISADIVFLSPEQLKHIPDKYVDIAIAIDCLHEMTTISIQNYFSQFDRLSKYFYFKNQIRQWAETSDIVLTIDSYPIDNKWEKILHEKCHIPNDYFHAIYKM